MRNISWLLTVLLLLIIIVLIKMIFSIAMNRDRLKLRSQGQELATRRLVIAHTKIEARTIKQSTVILWGSKS